MEIDAHIHVYSPQLVVQDAPIILQLLTFICTWLLRNWFHGFILPAILQNVHITYIAKDFTHAVT